MYANGPDAKKDLLVSMIASAFFPLGSFAIFLWRHRFYRRHQALHAAKSQSNVCGGCKKTFSRLDALNVCLYSSLNSVLITHFL